MTKRFASVLLAGAALSSCASVGPIGGAPGITVVSTTVMPAPSGTDPAKADRTYRVGGRDRLLVDVVGFDNLRAREIETSGDGEISVPMAGRISAIGMTLGELEQKVRTNLQQAHVRDPQVGINLVELRSRLVTVNGSVRRPGSYPVLGRMTLMQSVASAEGATEFARMSDVVVFRTVQGRKMVALYNLGAIQRGIYDDPDIFEGDIVVVGESSGRRLFQQIVQASALITTPLVAILNNTKL